MNICMCGWYFSDAWYALMRRLRDRHSVFVVANKRHPLLQVCGLDCAVRENTGLEWGAYSKYLSNHWDGSGKVLFTHDDMALLPTVKDGSVIEDTGVFDWIEDYPCDQAYVFRSRDDDVKNYGIHGRMLVVSQNLAEWLREHGGIWYDNHNSGYTGGDRPVGKVDHYNAGIARFDRLIRESGLDVGHKLYVPGLVFGDRGEFKGAQIC